MIFLHRQDENKFRAISGEEQTVPKVIQDNSGIQLSSLCIVNEETMKGLVTDKKQVPEIFNHYFSRTQNVGGGHDSDPNAQVNVAVDISVHPSIAAIRDEWVLAAQFEFNHVSKTETQLILKSLDPNKATGHDQIPARVLQNGASVLADPVARLINTVTDNACVPAEWKSAEICPPNAGLYSS